MNTPAQILVELKSLQEELAQQEKACGLAARFFPGDLGNGLNEFSTFCLFTGGRLEAAIAQLEAAFDAGNERDDQQVKRPLCTFDTDDPKAALILIADHIDKMQLGVEHVSPATSDKRDPGIGCVQTHTWLHGLMGCAHEARRIASQMIQEDQ